MNFLCSLIQNKLTPKVCEKFDGDNIAATENILNLKKKQKNF